MSRAELAEFATRAQPLLGFVMRSGDIHAPFGFTGGRSSYAFPICVAEQTVALDPRCAWPELNRELATCAHKIGVEAELHEKLADGLDGFVPGHCRPAGAVAGLPDGTRACDAMSYSYSIPGRPEILGCLFDPASERIEVLPGWMLLGKDWIEPRPLHKCVAKAVEIYKLHSWPEGDSYAIAAGLGPLGCDLLGDVGAQLDDVRRGDPRRDWAPPSLPSACTAAINAAVSAYAAEREQELAELREIWRSAAEARRSSCTEPAMRAAQLATVALLLSPDYGAWDLSLLLVTCGVPAILAEDLAEIAVSDPPEEFPAESSDLAEFAIAGKPLLEAAEVLLATDMPAAKVAAELKNAPVLHPIQGAPHKIFGLLNAMLDYPGAELESELNGRLRRLLPRVADLIKAGAFDRTEAVCVELGFTRNQAWGIVTALATIGFPWSVRANK